MEFTAGPVEAREVLRKIRSCGVKAENLKKQMKRRKWTSLSKGTTYPRRSVYKLHVAGLCSF